MTDIQLGSTIKRNNSYPFQRVMDETVIVEPRTRQMHHLNEIGTDIWDILSEPHTIRDVISRIMEGYEVDNTTLQSDVMNFLQEMMSRNLIMIHTE